MLSELQKADPVLADCPGLHKTGIVEWKKCVRGSNDPSAHVWQCQGLGSTAHWHFTHRTKINSLVEKSYGLCVRTVIYSPTAKTRGWGDSGCVCVLFLCKQPHTHKPIVETEAVWAAYEGRVCSWAQTQPPQQSGCFTSSWKKISQLPFCICFPIKVPPDHLHQLRGQSWRVKQLAELH